VAELAKENKILKEEVKTMARKYDNIEEELAIKNIELKDFKQKKMSI